MKKICTLSLVLFVLDCSAQWSNTANQFYDSLHMPVCTATGDQTLSMSITSYPDGGTIVFWQDKRDGFYNTVAIYAQKFDKAGNRLWADNGVRVAVSANNQQFTFSSLQDYRNRTVAASDYAGGFYITYTDDSAANYNWKRVCVQHLKSDGSPMFAGAGYIVAQTPAGESYNYAAPQLIADDNGGFYVAYAKNAITDYMYVYCYKDEGGTMKLYGGGLVNENAIQIKDPMPCLGAYKWNVVYPVTTVLDYNIWPDLQGGCSIVMYMNGNTGAQYKMLCYNRVWKAKKAARVTVATLWPTGDPNSLMIDYAKGDIDILYTLRHNMLNRTCTEPGSGTYLWVDDVLLSNGYLVLDQGAADYNFPKGTTVATNGNINVELITSNKRIYTGSNSLSDFSVEAIGLAVEKYDSVPYQRASNNDPYFGYNSTLPAQLNTLNNFRDTLLATGVHTYDFSLASGGNQVYAAAMMDEPGQSLSARSVRLQHLSIERQSASAFAIVFKTTTNKGEQIGRELGTGFGSSEISYDFPLVTANNTGNALFYIREYGRYIRVSPIGNGAELSWGAMGKPIGTPIFSGNYYYPDQPSVSLDPLNGSGTICWQDSRIIPANTRLNIFMRHLDSLNVANYSPLNKKLKSLIRGTTTANPAVLIGTSGKYSTIEAYNSITGTTSAVVEILDNYNLGAIDVNVYENTDPVRVYNGKPYLNRNYTIKPENNPNGAANINVRLFFTTTEFDALKAADPAIVDPGSLIVVKQPNAGITVPAAYTPAGGEEMLTPIAWSAVDGGYYIEVVVTGFSNFFIQMGNAALPVKWLGVQAVWQNSTQAKLSWQVAEQQNVKDYTVEQSGDGAHYTNVCTVTASAITSYSCIVPAKSDVKNYYRILQQDIDGKATYSKVVVLQSFTKPSLTVYPNPVKDKLYIDGLTGYRTLEITDANGRVIQKLPVLPGTQYVNASRLGAGVYLLTITGDKETQTIKFIRY